MGVADPLALHDELNRIGKALEEGGWTPLKAVLGILVAGQPTASAILYRGDPDPETGRPEELIVQLRIIPRRKGPTHG